MCRFFSLHFVCDWNVDRLWTRFPCIALNVHNLDSLTYHPKIASNGMMMTVMVSLSPFIFSCRFLIILIRLHNALLRGLSLGDHSTEVLISL